MFDALVKTPNCVFEWFQTTTKLISLNAVQGGFENDYRLNVGQAMAPHVMMKRVVLENDQKDIQFDFFNELGGDIIVLSFYMVIEDQEVIDFVNDEEVDQLVINCDFVEGKKLSESDEVSSQKPESYFGNQPFDVFIDKESNRESDISSKHSGNEIKN